MDFLNNLPLRMFTALQARITQEEDGFRVSIRMHNNRKDADSAWGVETASSIEMASGMIARLAQHYSITQSCISIKIVMNNFRENTLTELQQHRDTSSWHHRSIGEPAATGAGSTGV